MASPANFSILQKMVEIDPGFTVSLLKLVFKYLIESKQFFVKWSLRNTDNGICDQFAKFRILELEQSHSITRILWTSKGNRKASIRHDGLHEKKYSFLQAFISAFNDLVYAQIQN